MPEYDIPLSTIYERGEGKRVRVVTVGGRKQVTVTDFTGEPPHDIVRLSRGEAEELVHVLLAYLNQDNDGTLGYGAPHGSFEAHRVDGDRPALPDRVKTITGGAYQYHCEECGQVWAGFDRDEAAMHDCS